MFFTLPVLLVATRLVVHLLFACLYRLWVQTKEGAQALEQVGCCGGAWRAPRGERSSGGVRRGRRGGCVGAAAGGAGSMMQCAAAVGHPPRVLKGVRSGGRGAGMGGCRGARGRPRVLPVRGSTPQCLICTPARGPRVPL